MGPRRRRSRRKTTGRAAAPRRTPGAAGPTSRRAAEVVPRTTRSPTWSDQRSPARNEKAHPRSGGLSVARVAAGRSVLPLGVGDALDLLAEQRQVERLLEDVV